MMRHPLFIETYFSTVLPRIDEAKFFSIFNFTTDDYKLKNNTKNGDD